MHLNRLRALVAVIEQGGFSQAARSLKISQPAISQQIKALEADLATPLLERSAGHVRATAAGKAVYPRAKDILALWDEVEETVRQLRGQPLGRLTIGASTVPATYLLPPLIFRFREARPQVDVAVEVSDSERVRDAVLHGRVDAGAVGSHRPDPRLADLPLGDDELLLIVPCTHPFARREGVTIEEVASEPFVTREPGSGTRRTLEEALAAWGVGPGSLAIAAEVGSTEAVVGAVEAGVGISFVSRWAVRPALALGRVCTVPVQAPPIRRRFFLIARPGRLQDPLVRDFWQLVGSQPPLAENHVV